MARFVKVGPLPRFGKTSSLANLPDRSEIMYQPLYAFGQNAQPMLTKLLSLALPPAFSRSMCASRRVLVLLARFGSRWLED